MKHLWCIALTLSVACGLSACKGTQETENPGPAGPTPIQGPQADGQGRYSDAEKQRLVQDALLSLREMTISTTEVVADQYKTQVVNDYLASNFAQLTFNVTRTTSPLAYNLTPEQAKKFRRDSKAQFAIIVEASSSELDNFSGFYVFSADVKGKVVNLSTGQQIAAKTVRKKGKRSSDRIVAGEQALEVAAAELFTGLTDEMARQWEALSLIKCKIEISGADWANIADDIRVGLSKYDGIHYVELVSWDRDGGKATYEVLCRGDVKRFLVGYCEMLRKKNRVHIRRIDGGGELIRAVEHWYPAEN